VAAWNIATPYVIGNQVYKLIGGVHLGFTAKTNHTGTDPETDTTATDWKPTGPTNRWKMFDGAVQSQTENAESIEVTLVLPPTQWIDSLAVLNVDAASLRIRVFPPGAVAAVRDETFSLVSSSGIDTLWDYFTEPIERIADKVVIGLPPYIGATIQVTIAAPGGTAKCGALVMGFAKRLGDTRWGGRLGIIDYSKKQRNDFGDLEVFERAYARSRDFSVLVKNTFVDQLDVLLTRYRATAVLWVGSPRFGSTIVWGYYRGLEIVFEHPPDYSECRLELESLT
ncbi:MAG: hypothetical protein U1C74_20705, partial [Phenylobacterium sp.]|nr:hypothetical protein [Phenylobacterium sp.]